jgi:hypothetical protein
MKARQGYPVDYINKLPTYLPEYSLIWQRLETPLQRLELQAQELYLGSFALRLFWSRFLKEELVTYS